MVWFLVSKYVLRVIINKCNIITGHIRYLSDAIKFFGEDIMISLYIPSNSYLCTPCLREELVIGSLCYRGASGEFTTMQSFTLVNSVIFTLT